MAEKPAGGKEIAMRKLTLAAVAALRGALGAGDQAHLQQMLGNLCGQIGFRGSLVLEGSDLVRVDAHDQVPDNFRGGNGNVGIIRSPVRAIALPDNGVLTEGNAPAHPDVAAGSGRFS